MKDRTLKSAIFCASLDEPRVKAAREQNAREGGTEEIAELAYGRNPIMVTFYAPETSASPVEKP